LGCAVENSVVRVDDAQETTIAGVYCCGEPTGIGGVDLALVEGEIAGHSAVAKRAPSTLVARRAARRLDARRLDRAFTLRRELLALADAETIVCRCEDVRWGALDRRWSSRQAKLYTRVGMGPCQGRVCGAALECLMGWAPDSVRIPTQPARCHALVDRVASELFPNEPGVS
jgi:D-hydroxyproline dehydrogenase subunit alpha